MIRPRKIPLLLWAGPAFFVLNFIWINAHDLLGYGPFEVRDRYPYVYTAIMMPIGMVLIAFALGVWFSLRMLAGRDVPIATVRYIPFGELRLRLDEILPAAAAFTIASPALQYLFPHFFTTVDRIHLVQAPAIFAPWFIAWAVWSMPVSRVMKLIQAIVPVLILLGLLARSIAEDVGYIAIFVQVVTGPVWLLLTSYWLTRLIRQRPGPAGWLNREAADGRPSRL